MAGVLEGFLEIGPVEDLCMSEREGINTVYKQNKHK